MGRWNPAHRPGVSVASQAWETDGVGPFVPLRLHARFYELAPNLVPMDYRKSPIVHVPMSLIIQMPELRVWGVMGCGVLGSRPGEVGDRVAQNLGVLRGMIQSTVLIYMNP